MLFTNRKLCRVLKLGSLKYWENDKIWKVQNRWVFNTIFLCNRLQRPEFMIRVKEQEQIRLVFLPKAEIKRAYMKREWCLKFLKKATKMIKIPFFLQILMIQILWLKNNKLKWLHKNRANKDKIQGLSKTNFCLLISVFL